MFKSKEIKNQDGKHAIEINKASDLLQRTHSKVEKQKDVQRRIERAATDSSSKAISNGISAMG